MSNSPIANIDDKTSLVLGKRNDNFLAKAILLEEATPPSYMRATIKLATYSLVIFLIWSFFANLDVVANATGQVTPIQSVKILQHVDGGRISAINVVDGQRVVEGQVLMRFNATEPTVEFETLNVKFWGLFAKVESLRALLESREPDYSRVPKQYSQLVADQRRTLTAARKQIDQIGAEIKILTEVSSIRGGLAQEKLATRVQALDAERSLGQAQAELLRYRKANMDDLAASSNEMAQTEEQLAKMRDRLERIEVLSPVDGVVQDLKFRTVGGVVPPATILMNVVPTDGGIHADLRVSPNDIGFVKIGQKARVKINAYDFMRYGSVEGKVVMISPFSTFDEKQQPYFKVIVSLPKSVVGDDPSKTIQPGMTVQTDVITDKQSVLRYLTRPIYVAFHQGLRER